MHLTCSGSGLKRFPVLLVFHIEFVFMCQPSMRNLNFFPHNVITLPLETWHFLFFTRTDHGISLLQRFILSLPKLTCHSRLCRCLRSNTSFCEHRIALEHSAAFLPVLLLSKLFIFRNYYLNHSVAGAFLV